MWKGWIVSPIVQMQKLRPGSESQPQIRLLKFMPRQADSRSQAFNLSGNPVVKIPFCGCRGLQLDPRWELISCMPLGKAKKKKNRKKKSREAAWLISTPGADSCSLSLQPQEVGKRGRFAVCLQVWVSWVVQISGVSQQLPWDSNGRGPAWGELFPKTSHFLWAAPGALPEPTSSFGPSGPAAGLQSGRPRRPVCLPCNRIIYIIPLSRNKTTTQTLQTDAVARAQGPRQMLF